MFKLQSDVFSIHERENDFGFNRIKISINSRGNLTHGLGKEVNYFYLYFIYEGINR